MNSKNNFLNKTWSFILVAAGAGARLGGESKQFRFLNDKQVWRYSFDIAQSLLLKGFIDEIVVVFPRSVDITTSNFKFKDKRIKFIYGGDTRSESVKNGLSLSVSTNVLIHDAARPFLTEKLCLDLINIANKTGASIPILKATDSIKMLHDDNSLLPLDRNLIFLTQTPQLFIRDKLLSIICDNKDSYTDEATIWINHGEPIAYSNGEETNFKITTQLDWERAVYMTQKNRIIRTGHGFDVHQLVEGRDLILAGIKINEFDRGLLGHSDADIIIHAIMDALLGAAGEPDIGTLFPSSDIKYKNISSVVLIKEIIELLTKKGWHVEWIDVTLVAQIPKLGNLIPKFIGNLNKLFSDTIEKRHVNLKVKSGEKCGSVGRCESMECYAVATISK
ncbi:MAG: 2-C-methyl-D-erythritol 2,4-cyclodiphosphate synthase [Synergistaceae bacterium]